MSSVNTQQYGQDHVVPVPYIRLLTMFLGHHFVSFPDYAVAIAVIVNCYRQFPLSNLKRVEQNQIFAKHIVSWLFFDPISSATAKP